MADIGQKTHGRRGSLSSSEMAHPGIADYPGQGADAPLLGVADAAVLLLPGNAHEGEVSTWSGKRTSSAAVQGVHRQKWTWRGGVFIYYK